ncbi:MAG: cobyrinic acid a,c-diamide synthase [Acidimicrobiia bacterium]|nr:cobyrinic acid a,c-diamide synthase [Acidimicrobiia bacterium]
MAAFRAAGTRVAGAKVGPDFIDPGYHSLATGRPPRNIDAWMCGVTLAKPLAARAGLNSEILIIEGVMGLFDGAADGTPSSTADVAAALDAPVVLVVDAASMSSSVAAVVRGFRDHDPRLRLAGVILNRVASDTHASLLTEALDGLGVAVLGTIRRDDRLTWRDRHLGLVPVAERPQEASEALARLAESITASCDLTGILRAARSAPELRTEAPAVPTRIGSARVAVAGGPAFTFGYQDNLEALRAAGAEIVPFDPLRDEALPDRLDGLVVGGGFPEEFGEQLAANRQLLADVRQRIESGLTTWAECGGLLWLAKSLDGRPMSGVVDAEAQMTGRLTLGYRQATTALASPLGPVGTALRGHEFHYSQVTPTGSAVHLEWRFGRRTDGFASPSLLATYLHVHLAGKPQLAEHFMQTCLTGRRS